MPTRYETIALLTKQSQILASTRQADATKVAKLVAERVAATFSMPPPPPAPPPAAGGAGGLRPTVELCRAPSFDAEPISIRYPAPPEEVVETEDGQKYRCGIILRHYVSVTEVYAFVFRLSLVYMNANNFEVRTWPTAASATLSPNSAAQSVDPLCTQMFDTINDFLTKRAAGALSTAPKGFEMVYTKT